MKQSIEEIIEIRNLKNYWIRYMIGDPGIFEGPYQTIDEAIDAANLPRDTNCDIFILKNVSNYTRSENIAYKKKGKKTKFKRIKNGK
jgi:hypothetical protein